MEQHTNAYLHILDRNQLSDGTQLLHVKEVPPPYSSVVRQQYQSTDNDWKDEFIEIQPLQNNLHKYGFTISGGVDTEYGSPIVITHIDHCSNSEPNNGRTELRLFDRILSVNDINLTDITHNEAARVFSSARGRSVLLHIRRLNPAHIEAIDVIMPVNTFDQPLGISITGGLEENSADPGLFIDFIDPNGLLASITVNNQLHVGDRLLEIKTNHTSANLQWVARSEGVQLIQRICHDHKYVTFVVARQN